MGYIDAETGIELRDKILEKAEEKARRLLPDKHVFCNLGIRIISSDPLSSQMFLEQDPFTEGCSYSYAVANQQGFHFFYKGNGNGVKAASNDYLRQRKKYLNAWITESAEADQEPTMRDLLEFLLSPEMMRGILRYSDWSLEKTSDFPARGGGYMPRKTKTILFKTDMYFDSFVEHIEEDSGLSSHFLKRNGSASDDFRAYRAKLYVVENQFERPNDGGKFCERVYGYLNLIVSVNKDPSDDTTLMYISQLRDK